MKQHEFKTDQQLNTTLEHYAPDFKPFFETRVMSKITQLKEQSYDYLFSRAFQRVALSGIAAVAILLITIYVSDGSISTDALVGTSNLNVENVTAMTLTGF